MFVVAEETNVLSSGERIEHTNWVHNSSTSSPSCSCCHYHFSQHRFWTTYFRITFHL